MAYKFQLGSFTASGSIKAESGFDAADANVTNVGDIALDSISGDANDITINLTDNRQDGLSISEGSNVYMNFDTRNGAEIINVGKKMQVMDDTKLEFGSDGDASFEYDEDGTDTLLYTGASIRISDDTKLEFGSGGDASFEYDEDGNDVLLYAGANIRIPDDTKIEFGNAGDAGIEYDENGTDQLRIHAATAGMVVEIGGQSVLTIDSSGNSTFAGNLTVQGETTTVDSTTINISSSFTFEGPADDFETELDSGTPISDTNIQLPQLGVAGTYYLPALVNNPGGAGAISASVGELNLLDGDTTVGTTALASGDGFIHNDNGTMRMTSINKIGDYLAGDGLAVSSGVLAVGVDDTGIEINSDALRLKDNGVTLAKMAGLSRGSFIIGDSSGDPSALSLGTDAQILISDGSDLAYVSLSGDVTIANNGATTIGANAVEGSMLNNNVVSGLTDIGAAITDTDELIVSDGGTIRRSDFSRLKTYIGAGTTTVTSGSNAATLAAGVNYFGAHGGAISATLPGSSAPSVGDSVMIKAGADCSSTNTLTINAYANHTIDGASLIVLESPFAAVECVYVVSGSWRVF